VTSTFDPDTIKDAFQELDSPVNKCASKVYQFELPLKKYRIETSAVLVFHGKFPILGL